jgi:hypothetical protein
MENEIADKENQAVVQQVNYTRQDLIKAEHPKLYSTIGKTVESIKPSAPIYSFGKAERKDMEKVFCSKGLVKTQFMCKASPGPIYNPTIDPIVKTGPKFSFAGIERDQNVKEPYDYYLHEDPDFDPIGAQIKAKRSLPVIKFKTGSRVS